MCSKSSDRRTICRQPQKRFTLAAWCEPPNSLALKPNSALKSFNAPATGSLVSPSPANSCSISQNAWSPMLTLCAPSRRTLTPVTSALSRSQRHTPRRATSCQSYRTIHIQIPRVQLVLKQGNPEEICNLVDTGEADLAIGTDTLVQYPNLVRLPCFALPRSVVAKAGIRSCRSRNLPAGCGELSDHLYDLRIQRTMA